MEIIRMEDVIDRGIYEEYGGSSMGEGDKDGDL